MTDTLIEFDGGTPGNAVVAGANGIDTIQGGAPEFATGFHGAACVRCGSAANTTNTHFRVDLGGIAGDHFGSIYLINTTAHGSGSASVNFFQMVTALNEFIVQMRVKPSSQLSVRVSNIEVWLGSLNDIPVNAWFRMDWQQSGTTFTFKIFLDPEADSASTPDITDSVTTSAVVADGLIIGAVSTSSIPKDWSFDTIRATDTGTWFAPFNPPPATGVMVWDGTDEIPGAITVWDGTDEIEVLTLEVN